MGTNTSRGKEDWFSTTATFNCISRNMELTFLLCYFKGSSCENIFPLKLPHDEINNLTVGNYKWGQVIGTHIGNMHHQGLCFESDNVGILKILLAFPKTRQSKQNQNSSKACKLIRHPDKIRRPESLIILPAQATFQSWILFSPSPAPNNKL